MTESSGPAAAGMTDSMSPGTRRCFPRTSKSRISSQLNARPNSSGNHPASDPTRLGESPAEGLAQMRYPRTRIRELRVIPATMIAQWKEMFKTLSRVKCPSSDCWCEFPSVFSLKQHYERCQGVGLAFRLRFSCPSCEAVFVAKAQLQKHLVWNHSDRGGTQEQRPKQSAFDSGGKERAAERPLSLQRHSRQATVHPPEENGDVTPHSRHKQRLDEDPGRVKHRRKQKTPKKFTGEQPSITGAFTLKGLGKAEDKSRTVRRKLVRVRKEEPRKRMAGANVSRDDTAPLPGSMEDACQKQIIKRGEVTCPNCVSITRKTMAGLRKHMEVCEQLQEALRCQHCRKQFKSKAGLNYHTMAEHMNKDTPLDEQKERERLRKVLKQMGKLRCAKQNCSATFSSLVGYQYHMRRCGQEPAEEAKLLFSCPYCTKVYQSKAGRNYHVRSEHCTAPRKPAPVEEEVEMMDVERTPSGRVRRQSAQLAVFHLQEIAEDELAREGSRRRMREDLVPDSKRLNYLRPGLPTFNPQLLESWKTRVKEDGFICCPNNCCEAIYSSVSGLKAHLANCSKGNHLVGKYRCLLCQKEFSSESGVKYHILKTHSQNWFRVSSGSLLPKKKAILNFSATDSVTVSEVKRQKRRASTSTATLKSPLQTKDLPPVIKTQPLKLPSKACAGRSHTLSFRGTSRKGFPATGRK